MDDSGEMSAAKTGFALPDQRDIEGLAQDVSVKSQNVLHVGAKRYILNSLKSTKPSRPVKIPVQNPAPRGVLYTRNIRFLFLDSDDEAETFDEDIWEFLSDDLKGDREIALTAFVAQHARLEDLPAPWCQDRAFFLEAVSKRPKLWFRIPRTFQLDPLFAVHLCLKNDDMIAFAFEKNPQLSGNRQLWDRIISRFSREDDDILEGFPGHPDETGPSRKCSLTYAPASIRSDLELMTKACSIQSAAFARLDESLAMKREFLVIVLKEKPFGLLHLSENALLAFPDLVETGLPKLLETGTIYGRLLAERLDPSIFEREAFARAWFCSGGPFLAEVFPESWRDREDIFLWIAEHSSGAYHLSHEITVPYKYASDRLKGNLEVMIQATEYHEGPFECASDAIKGNFELVARALSHSQVYTKKYMNKRDDDEWRYWIESIYGRLRGELRRYVRFVRFFLSQLVDTKGGRSSTSPLRILNQGPETTLVYKKLIAEYLGVPFGKRLLIYNGACVNIRNVLEEG